MPYDEMRGVAPVLHVSSVCANSARDRAMPRCARCARSLRLTIITSAPFAAGPLRPQSEPSHALTANPSTQ